MMLCATGALCATKVEALGGLMDRLTPGVEPLHGKDWPLT